MALISLAHKFLSSKCEGDAGRNIHGRARIQPVARRALISSYNEEPSRGWDDFKVGAGFGATVLGLTAAWAGSPMIPSVLGGAFGGGTLGYSYFQMTRFLESKHQRSDAVTHAFAGSASGYLYASILYGPKSIKAGAMSGGVVGLMIYFGAESIKEWRYEAGLKRRIARSEHMVPPGVRKLDEALDAGHITEKEHASYREFLIQNDRSKEDAEHKYAELQAAKRERAQTSATLWPSWLPLQKMSDEDVKEREERARRYHQAHLRMQALQGGDEQSERSN